MMTSDHFIKIELYATVIITVLLLIILLFRLRCSICDVTHFSFSKELFSCAKGGTLELC